MPTDRQLVAVKYLISKSRDGDDLSKRIAWYLIDHSDMLTSSVCISLSEQDQGYDAETINSTGHKFDYMLSSNGSTHLDQVLLATGCNLHFSVHYGNYNPMRPDPLDTSGMFPGWPVEKVSDPRLVIEGMPMRYTFWLATKSYSSMSRYVSVTREELEAIDLCIPLLYLFDESSR